MKAMFVGGKYNGMTVDVEFVKKLFGNGKFTADYSEIRANGGFTPRAELDNQPLVDGYLEPCWDGGMLRYETQEVYNFLTSD